MKLLLDIEEHKASFMVELLQSLPFVKAKTVTDKNLTFLKELSGSVKEVITAKENNAKLQSAKDLLNEL